MSADLNAPWPFDQPPNCVAFTTRQVVEREEPILFISHDADDDGWQFIGSSAGCMENAMVVLMKEIVQLDPTVFEVANLIPGWICLEQTRTRAVS